MSQSDNFFVSVYFPSSHPVLPFISFMAFLLCAVAAAAVRPGT